MSTATNIICYTNYILDALETEVCVHSIYTGFSKAFDWVDHKILLNKPAVISFSSNTVAWFSSYLKDRRVQAATSGVLQGSHWVLQ